MTDPGAPEDLSSPAEPGGDDSAQVQTAKKLSSFKSRSFFPADYAAVENGKVYVSGGFWSVLRFAEFPAVLPTMSLVAVIEVPFHANFSGHALSITLVDQDEKPAGVKIEGMFRSAPTIESRFGAPGLTPVAVPIQGLQIDRPGEYVFKISVDGDELDRYSFDVIQIANVNVQPPASPPAE